MENIIDIAKILRSYKIGTKLYSTAFGNVIFKGVDPYNENVDIEDANGYCIHTDKFGKYTKNGECILFPSKEMKDWEKFGWKKGDVLMRMDEYSQEFCIFDSFTDDEYDTFNGKFHNEDEHHFNEWQQYRDDLSTKDFYKASDKETDEIIKKIERHYGGTLNLSTLEIVKNKTIMENSYKDYIFKPKEWCLMHHYYFPKYSTKLKFTPWVLCQYSHKYCNNFVAVGGNEYSYCIPYNNETAYLLGTTDDENREE